MPDSLDLILSEIDSLCADYWRQYSEPIKLQSLAQKWAKRCRRLDVSLLNSLRTDSRFLVDLSKSGAYRVCRVIDLDTSQLILSLLRRDGGRLALPALHSLLLCLGLSVDLIQSEIERLTQIGVLSQIEVESGVIVELLVD